MPFSIYAAEQTQIVPTWNWGSQYANQFTVTNFCEGSGTAVSCELRFTANNSYYGYLSFDGYNGTTKWIDYKNVWIADGYGAYRYSLYQNGVIQINKINIEGGFIKSSMDNLDLQDIIDLLTAIETDTTSIDNQMNTELQRLQSIINNQIVQNGYLETLTKLRQWSFPSESLSAILGLLDSHDTIGFNTYNNWIYPMFNLNQNDRLYHNWLNGNHTLYVVYLLGSNIYNLTTWNNNFELYGNSTSIQASEVLTISRPFVNGIQWNLVKASYPISRGSTYDLYYRGSSVLKAIPIYVNDDESFKYMTTDFALQYGFTNPVLDDLNLIAQGSQQSQQAGSDLDNATSDMQSDFNSYYSIENSANSDFNSALNGINFNDQIAGNQSFLDSASFVKTVFSSMMQIPILSTFVIILCIVLMARIFL